jgi:pimeloyl-ACP methyl ester carboxylesterase
VPDNKKEVVVLIHGLWLSGPVLLLLAGRLRRAGFAVRTYSYPSVRLDFQANAERLQRFLQTLKADTVHLAGHSLGGVLIRALHYYFPQQRPGRIVTLGAPHGDCQTARHLERSRFWRWAMGRSVAQLLEGVPRQWPLPVREIGVISGTRSMGLGRFLFRQLPRPNDGLLSVSETCLPGAREQIVLPISHTGMLFSRRVAGQLAAFLRNGRFTV